MLWVDQHRPTRLDDLSYHDTIKKRLIALANNPEAMPHLFFYGPTGAGKKTRIHCLLQALYGNGATKLKLDQRTFTTPTNKTIQINLVTSNHHIEICPGDAGLNDRFVIQDVIKEIASNQNISCLNVDNAANTGTTKAKPLFKTVVLFEVDQLSRQAQAALRRTMEKYAKTCRLILCCDSMSKVMEPVRSRCLGIRVSAPTHDEIADVLIKTARRESVTLPEDVAVSLARASDRNLRRAILMLEAMNTQGLTKDQPIPQTDWEMYISQIAVDITKEQSPQRLATTREKLYELLVNCIPPTILLKTLVRELLRNLDDSLKPDVIEWAAFYEHRIAMGSKEIFHLEAFVAKYMALYKKYLNELFNDF